MRSAIAVAVVSFAVACHRPDPSWATTNVEHRGEPTIAGEPLAIPKLARAPVVDGKLDDAAWTSAAVLGPLVDPGNGATLPSSPVAAFARVGWTDDALWLGVVVRDRKPVAPFGRDDVDPHVWGKSSGVELVLQPGDPGDNRDYYELQVDVGGAVFDSHFDDYNAPMSGTGAAKIFGHQDWSSGVERARIVARGSFYSVEVSCRGAQLPARASRCRQSRATCGGSTCTASATASATRSPGRRCAARAISIARRDSAASVFAENEAARDAWGAPKFTQRFTVGRFAA